MTVANLNGLQVVIHEGEVLTNAEQWAAKLEAASAELKELREKEARSLANSYARVEEMNHRVNVENYLINASKGNRPLPNAEDCKVMALRLGTPREHWTDYLVKYKYGSKKPVKE